MEEITKLTAEESHRLDSFIGTCVRKNVAFSFKGNRLGNMQQTGIQEIYNASIRDIETYGESVYKAMQDSGSPFAGRKKTMQIDGKVPASEVVENLQLIIQEKEFATAERRLANQIHELETQLEGMKSESEIKEELKQKLSKLKGVTASTSIETPVPHE